MLFFFLFSSLLFSIASSAQGFERCEAMRQKDYCAVKERGPVPAQRVNDDFLANETRTTKFTGLIGLLLAHSSDASGAWLQETAVAMAMADVECAGILKRTKLIIQTADSGCDSRLGIAAFVQIALHPFLGIIGPECSSVARVMGQISHAVNFPMVVHAAEDALLSNIAIYPQLFRMSAPGSLYSSGWVSYMRQLGWTEAVVIREVGHEYDEFVRLFENSLRQSQDLRLAGSVSISAVDLNETHVVEEIVAANSRLVVVMVYPRAARKILCEAIQKVSSTEKD